ncbi:MAG: 5'-methylthioadenosine/adenosylhomocysteine nucleosidase [Johnsonella sp.]|nr:5'-methylthioadenosine/adenosylhomocysteine nucleosidase [Johnsonella sp.]
MTGIIGAMEEEVTLLREKMEEAEIRNIAGMCFYKGKIEGREVVLVRSGVGKVNAAVCTQILISVFGVDRVINSGIAGSLDERIEIGDIVISSDAVEHDMDASGFGYALGEIPRMDRIAFEADQALGELAKRCCLAANPGISCFIGRIASGDIFVSDMLMKKKIKKEFKALCTEMEGAAIAHTAFLNQVPFLIIRAISDKADGSASVDYCEFEAAAIGNCSRLTLELLRSAEF